jgi:hypothetical protein
MKRRSAWIAGGAIMIAITAGNATVATSREDDKSLTGPAFASATEAALDHTAGTVTETEVGDDGAAYGVEIRRADGSEVEISLDENFTVVGEESDDSDKDDRDDDGSEDRGNDGTDDRDD